MRRLWPLGLGLTLLAGCADAPTIPQVNPLPEGRLSSDYGVRSVDPLTGEAKSSGHHDGYDLAAAMGTPIRASKAGKVIFAGRKGGYGNAIVLSHPGGWSTLYGHASRLAVEVGQEVNAGQVVAYVGSTGHSTGPHLHYELRKNGKAVDPGLFTASVPSESRPRKAEARRSRPTPPPVPPQETRLSETAPEAEDVAGLEAIPADAPPLRYPDDPDMRSAMQALDGAPLSPEPAAPPTFWQRIQRWVAGVIHHVAAIFSMRRAT